MIQAVLTTDWNKIKNLDDFNAQWPSFSADMSVYSLSDAFAKPSCDGRISDLDDINDLVGYHELSGKYVSRLQSAHTLMKNDLFLVSQNRPISAGFETLSYTSRKLPYDRLSTQLFYDILEGLKLKSMAYREKYEFAVSSHRHDGIYTLANMSINPMYVKGSPAYLGDANVVDVCSCWLSTDSLTCAHSNKYASVTCNPSHARTDTRTFVWKVPKIKLPLPPRPMIGTVRFVGAPMVQALIDCNALSVVDASSSAGSTIQVNPYDASGKIRDDYDGWVFANGTAIVNRESALSAAALVYGSSSSSNFSVPCFNQFFKANGGSIAGSMSVVPAQAGLKSHLHITGQHNFNGNIKLDKTATEMFSTNGNGGGVYVHNGDASKGKHVATVVADTTISLDTAEFTNLRTTSCAAKGSNPYPKHQLVPVMIYIGGETEAYYESLYDKYRTPPVETEKYTVWICGDAVKTVKIGDATGQDVLNGFAYEPGTTIYVAGELPPDDARYSYSNLTITWDGEAIASGTTKTVWSDVIIKIDCTATPKPCIVSFDVQGHGSAPASQTVGYGGKVSEPAQPFEAGWIFGAWYKEAACANVWDFNSDVVTGTTVLYAKWTKEKSLNKIDASFSATDTSTATCTAKITVNSPVYSKNGPVITVYDNGVSIGTITSTDSSAKTKSAKYTSSGTHTYRVTCEGYEDWTLTKTFTFSSETKTQHVDGHSHQSKTATYDYQTAQTYLVAYRSILGHPHAYIKIGGYNGPWWIECSGYDETVTVYAWTVS